MRPPVPTSDHLPKDEARKQRRAALLPVVVGLAIVLGLAGFSALNRSTPPVVATFNTGDMAMDGAYDNDSDLHGQPVDPNGSFKPPSSVDELLMLRTNDEVLDDEPAGLPQPEQGRRIAAFARNEGQRREEFAFWSLSNTSMAQVISFYEQAARDQNFRRIPTSPTATIPSAAPTTAPATAQDQPPAEVTTMVFRRDGMRDASRANDDSDANQKKIPASDVLVIRAKPLDNGQVHVTLWYVQTNLTARN